MKNTICPNCQSNLESEVDISGLAIECPICKTTFTVKKDKKPQFIVNQKITNNTNFYNKPVNNSLQNNTTNRMFCRTCGSQVFNNAEVCIACGCFLNNGPIVYCPNCGTQKQYSNAVVCMNCGYSFINLKNQLQNNNKTPKWIFVFLFVMFLGNCGMHRFYTGHIATGITLLCLHILGWVIVFIPHTICHVLGSFFIMTNGIWVFVDFICIICGIFKTPDGRKISHT